MQGYRDVQFHGALNHLEMRFMKACVISIEVLLARGDIDSDSRTWKVISMFVDKLH